MYIHICVYKYMYIYIYIHMLCIHSVIHMYVCMYIYIYIYTHTHIHKCVASRFPRARSCRYGRLKFPVPLPAVAFCHIPPPLIRTPPYNMTSLPPSTLIVFPSKLIVTIFASEGGYFMRGEIVPPSKLIVNKKLFPPKGGGSS